MTTPQQHAFQRWSIPDVENEDVRGQSLALAPTIRADSLEAVAGMPAPPRSFRVYTPAEMKLAPMRPMGRSALLANTAPREEGLNARVLLKWTGVGILAGFAVLATLVFVLNFADDTTSQVSASTRAAIGQNLNAAPPPPVPVAPKPAQATPTDIELGAAAAAPPAPTPKPKKKKTKKS